MKKHYNLRKKATVLAILTSFSFGNMYPVYLAATAGAVSLGLMGYSKSAKADEVVKTNELDNIINVVNNKVLFSFSDVFNRPNVRTYKLDSKTLIIDLTNVTNKTGQDEIVPSHSDSQINSIQLAQNNGNNLRVVISFKSGITDNFAVSTQGNYLSLDLHNAFAPGVVVKSTATTTTATNLDMSTPYVATNTANTTTTKEVSKTVTTTTTVNNTATQAPAPIITAPALVISNPTHNNDGITSSVVDISKTNIGQSNIEKVDFIKGLGSIGKLVITLNSDSVKPELKRVGQNLEVILPNTSATQNLQRRVLVDQLTTPTKAMDIGLQQQNTKIVLEQGFNEWDYDMYQSNNQIVIEVKPMSDGNLQKAKKYTGKPLTLTFQNVDVRTILQVIAEFTGLNIIASDKVGGNMTIRLKDVPWDQALDVITESQSLDKIQQGNVIRIQTREETAAQQKLSLQTQAQEEQLAPLKTKMFKLNYYKAQDLKDLLLGNDTKNGDDKTSSSSSSSSGTGSQAKPIILSKRGTVQADGVNNTLIVQDTDQVLNQVEDLVKRTDIAAQQVLVDTKIVIANTQFNRELGAKFGISAATHLTKGTTIGLGGDATSAAGNASTGSGAANIGTLMFNNPIADTGGGAIGLSILNAAGNALNLELSALESNNEGKIISSPRVLTLNNQEATISEGTEIPYVTPSSANSPPTVSFKDAVLKLIVTPQISPNGRIKMNLDVRKDSVGENVQVQGGGSVPSIDTKDIKTNVTVKDGQTVVMGGVYEITTANDISKVPFLGDIPWVGAFFRNTTKSRQKLELLIFVTPHVVYDEYLDDGQPEKIELSK
jgi:type IV pilus assembly protein PilQ